IDTILRLGCWEYDDLQPLRLYRYEVNLHLLFVHVDLQPGRSSIQPNSTGCKNDVSLSGYNDQILRFVCERGSSRLLDHVDRIDDIFHLPRASESGRRHRVVESTDLSPLLQAPKLRWRTVRVFVSSTFRDMWAERDLLTRSVFPELRPVLPAIWQLEICLSEVSRCQLFVGILGERYGQILQEYPLPDLPQFEWVKSYPRGRSTTELEIEQFCRQRDECSSKTAFFYTRDPAVLRSLPERWLPDFAAESEEAKTRVAHLKGQLEEAELLALENYRSEWGGEVEGRPYLTGLEEFGASVLACLWEAIVRQHCQEDGGSEAGLAEDEEALQGGFLEAQSCRRFGRVKQLAAAVSNVRACRQGGVAFIIHGRPSEGKTAFMASLVTQLSTSHTDKCPGPSDLLFHFTAASERAQDGASMLHRLCVLLNTRLNGRQEIPRSYRGLVLEFHSLLDRVSRSQPRRHLVLAIDGADCIQTERGQCTSDWIPENLPRGVTLVLSVTDNSSLHRTLARRKGAVTFQLGPLEPLDRSEVVRRSLAVYGKKLEESAFNNQMRLLVMKKESYNPHFLKLASDLLREFGVFEKISEQIRALPSTLHLLIRVALTYLEGQHGAGMVTFALSALNASEKGLRERELYSVLCTSSGLRTDIPPPEWQEVMQETLKPSRPIPMATFAGLLRSLRCILGLWAPAEKPSSRLCLSNAQLREAVQLHYLRDSSQEKQVHLCLAAHLWRLTDPMGDGTFTDCDPEALADLPEHLTRCGELPRLASLLTNLRFLALHVRLGILPQLASTFSLYHAAASGAGESGRALPEMGPYRDFIGANLPVLSQHPSLFWQQALNQADSSPVCRQARGLLGKGGARPLPPEKGPDAFRLVAWTNKPQAPGGTEGKVMVTPTEPLCVSISPNGRTAVVGTSEGTLHILDLDSGQEVRSLASHGDGISGCVFLGESALCATSFDGKIEAWSLVDGCRLMLIDAHGDRITGCALSPDGKHLATCSWDRAVKVWVVATGSSTS
uniref:telomerase protein component 1-like n=1 Tax=Pristiophorus japonicus TaxID=55135 RepID=UPI00398E6792